MRILSVLACLFALCTAAAAQVSTAEIEKGMPPFKIPTKADSEGQQQWGTYQQNCPVCKAKKVVECTHCKHMEKPESCVECKTTRKAPCNYCGGKGELPDPLELAPCPGCNGHGVLVCYFCGNSGKIFMSSGGKSGQKCNACKANGGVACTVCDGERFVPSAFKGKVGDRDLKKLQVARKNLEQLIKSVENFSPKGEARLDRKKFATFFKKTRVDFPVLKDLQEFVEDVIKRLDYKNIKDNDKTQVRAWRRMQTNLLYYLVHQSKVLDQCIARLETNAKAEKAR